MSEKSEFASMAILTVLASILVFIGTAGMFGTWLALAGVFCRNVYRWLT
jgi:hypothetical protein